MKRDLVRTEPLTSSFLSYEKDTETILKKLFINSRPYSEHLKRLLIINTSDCLDDLNNSEYADIVKNTSIADLINDGYIKLGPKLEMGEHEEVKAYIIISYDNFTPNANNPKFRDCTINFDIICNTDCWNIGNYRSRPIKIVGYIDGLLDETRLSGIGKLNFLTCNELVLSHEWAGYSLSYRAIHGSDDQIPPKEE